MPPRTLLPVFADQLSQTLASLKDADPERDLILMVEVAEETDHVPHHRKKLAFLFSAMRHHAALLRANGWQVDYVPLDAPENSGSFTGEIARAVTRHKPGALRLTEPGDWRVREMARGWSDELGLPVDIRADDRFLCPHAVFAEWAKDRKQLRMEYFYRDMRRTTGLLMDGKDPVGGKWNYDADNRKPANADLFMPRPATFAPDDTTRAVLDLIDARFPDRFGALTPFWFAVTRQEAEQARDRFIADALPRFGDYQDAMVTGERFLYHSVLSLYINCGLLDPLETCKLVEQAYYAGHAPLNAAEGFIRQIIGWREYVRGIYWLKMPGYLQENALGAERLLPDFYWSGATKMTCVREAVTQTREDAYAHHIQRLMVTGTFGLLAGVRPQALHEWYLAVYADAFEWVELPNTLGMSQFADGGLLASKPYAASGNYINKMSDYCGHCAYDVKDKTGDNACPFNPLYWDFLERNRDRLGANPRLGQPYRTWDRMSETSKHAYRNAARRVLNALDEGVL